MGEVQKQTIIPSHPREPENLPCPRCDSTNTKFCYYNNYNLSQPRYYCKACRRYWTRGGTLRNVPVGGASRKSSKRSRLPPPSSAMRQEAPPCEVVDLNLSEGSSFTSLLTCESVSGLGVGFGPMSGFEEMGFGLSFGPMVMEANDGDGMEGGDCCFGWPDLAISTPRNGVDRVV